MRDRGFWDDKNEILYINNMIQILFAVIAGVLTIGAPCILPLLPILLGASIGQQSKTRPLFIALGFIVTFSITGLLLSFFVTSLNIEPDLLRKIAVFALGVFGLFMIWPTPFEKLTLHLSKYISKANEIGTKAGTGNFGGFILGVMLGVIWTPCAGPVLGSILTLIATSTQTTQAAILLIAYAIGAGLPMLAIAYGGQAITTRVRNISRYATRLQQIFGVIILGLAVAMFFQYDLLLQAKILEYYNFGNLEQRFIK
jgi:cytochrome c biogenesis protein CcdA